MRSGASVVIVPSWLIPLPWRAPRGEQAVLAHQAQDAPPRGAHAADAQARPDHAVAFA